MSSSIEWTHTPGTVGDTLEATIGCSPPTEECLNCYAAELVGRRLGKNPATPRYHGLAVINPNSDIAKWTGVVRLNPDYLTIPERTRRPTTYFVCSRSDLFHKDVPTSYIAEVFARARAVAMRGPLATAEHRHRFIFLTKRSERLASLRDELGASSLPESIAVGVSCGSQKFVRRIDDLRRFGAPTSLVSFEPLLGPVDVDFAGLSWGIVGGESGKRARPTDMRAAIDLVHRLDRDGVPPFSKQLGRVPQWANADGTAWAPRHPRGGDRSEWPPALLEAFGFAEFPRAWRSA